MDWQIWVTFAAHQIALILKVRRTSTCRDDSAGCGQRGPGVIFIIRSIYSLRSRKSPEDNVHARPDGINDPGPLIAWTSLCFLHSSSNVYISSVEDHFILHTNPRIMSFIPDQENNDNKAEWSPDHLEQAAPQPAPMETKFAGASSLCSVTDREISHGLRSFGTFGKPSSSAP